MTGILLTNENFKKFSKNLNKIKTEITLSQAQEELANIFGFKNLFHFKQTLSNSDFYITIENFKYFSSRLIIDLESSKIDNCFAKIIGYKDYNTFHLKMCANTFLTNLSDNIINIKNFDKCIFENLKDEFKCIIIINDDKYEKINITIKMGSDIMITQGHEIMNVMNHTEKKDFLTLDIDTQEKIISSFSIFKNKNKDFVDSIIPILKKIILTQNKMTKVFRVFLIKRKDTEHIDSDHYKAYYYIMPYNRLNRKISMLLPFNNEYIKSDCLAPFGSRFIYTSLEDAHRLIDKVSKIMKMNINKLCITEIYEPLFCDKIEKLSCRYFTTNDDKTLKEHSFRKFLLDK